MALDPLRTTTMVLIPHNGASPIQGSQVIPAPTMQTSGMVQFVQYQQIGSTSNQPQQSPQAGRLEKLLQVETKTLGAIQIMIGLMHIGFGSLQFNLVLEYYAPIAVLGCYPLWGGAFFIVSGSLSVAAEKHLSISLVKWIVGMNITSAVMTIMGIAVYIAELLINSRYNNKPSTAVGIGISVLLFIFSMLQFCITVSIAHFGCQATCCHDELMTTVFVPYTNIGDGVAPTDGNPSSPSFSTVESSSKEQAE